MLRQLGNLFESDPHHRGPRSSCKNRNPSVSTSAVLAAETGKAQVVQFSQQFYASGMIQPPPIPKSLTTLLAHALDRRGRPSRIMRPRRQDYGARPWQPASARRWRRARGTPASTRNWSACAGGRSEALHAHNSLPPGARGRMAPALAALFGRAAPDVVIEAPFHRAYGFNIALDEGVYLNAGCVILDSAPVRIGRRSLLGPAVQIYCAEHHKDPVKRAAGLEIARPVEIGEKGLDRRRRHHSGRADDRRRRHRRRGRRRHPRRRARDQRRRQQDPGPAGRPRS